MRPHPTNTGRLHDTVDRMAANREIVPGATLHYHEGRAEEPERVWEDNPFGSKYVTFRAVVDSVQGDYVELTTTTQPNGHVHAPDFGASMAKSKAVIESDPRWKLARD